LNVKLPCTRGTGKFLNTHAWLLPRKRSETFRRHEYTEKQKDSVGFAS
jgi:hypothetical protein